MNWKKLAWFTLSTALHLVVVILMLQAIFAPRSFVEFFRRTDRTIIPENITYVIPGKPLEPVTKPPPGNPDLPVIGAPVVIPPVRAFEVIPPKIDTGGTRPVPSQTPPAAATPPAGGGGGGGGIDPRPLAVIPAFKDTRIWQVNPPMAEPPATGLAGIRGSLDSTWTAKLDSMGKLTDPTDWTVGEGKGKFGIDPKWLYLGPIKLPTPLLALIPLNVQANPQGRENARTLGVMAAEARAQGVRNGNTRNEIKSINDRLNRQRDARRAAAGGSGGGAGGSEGGK